MARVIGWRILLPALTVGMTSDIAILEGLLGRNLVPGCMYLLSGGVAELGTLMSSFRILAANS